MVDTSRLESSTLVGLFAEFESFGGQDILSMMSKLDK